MASISERAYTCKLPSREVASLRSICPDWLKIDIIGQTIVLAELTPHFGSFQNTCTALKLQSNEVESFLLTHLRYQQAFKRGRLIAEQWGRNQAVPANNSEDIPQQRPVLISASSIAPACDFLKALGYQNYVPAVQAWSRRTITWPPHIDVTGIDISKLDQADIDFPPAQARRAYSRYTSSLGNDSRAVAALVGAWRPKEDGTPDTRISFFDVPDGSVAYGSHGLRQLTVAGRYYVCWPTDSLSDNPYNDFVLARNVCDIREGCDGLAGSPNLKDHRNIHASDELLQSNTDQDRDAPEKLYGKTSVNPKDIFGADISYAHNSKDKNMSSFHPPNEPQGPLRKLKNSQLSQAWSSWPGQIFQFRLPAGYTILGPQGHILTFDPPTHERYDEMGNPHGIGGTYFIIPPQKEPIAMSFKLDDLPANVSLRLKIPQRLVIIRNGMVLPRFIEPGVHEWSTREGFLDCYGAHGCYDVLHTEGRYSILPDASRSLDGRGVARMYEHMESASNVTRNPLPVEEGLQTLERLLPIEKFCILIYLLTLQGLEVTTTVYKLLTFGVEKILAPHRDWLDRQETETKRLEQELDDRARLDARNAREKVRRDILTEERKSRRLAMEVREAEERARIDAVVRADAAAAQGVQNRKMRRNSNSNNRFDLNLWPGDTQRRQQWPIDLTAVAVCDKTTPRRGEATGATRRKRQDSDDEEYTPTRSRQPRKPRSTPKTPTPKKSREKPAGDVTGFKKPRFFAVPENRQARTMSSQAQTVKHASGSAPTGMSSPPAATPRTSQSAITRKPIGPLLDAIRSSAACEGGNVRSLCLSTVPRVNEVEAATHAANDSGAIAENRMSLRKRIPKPPVPQECFDCDPEETECEIEH
ncbi:hypothetical protein NUW58_g1431 [Xylaria curta]|uniref:Uncharacterized protein n=1 Tax=Xylaria curta TaxID=42375 RepID=A0ACC1PKG2_9PEZI|nr:hypothetical protein NUW58_g1431 [Xylaria curta]